jgi:PAS domain S-box-containing protein
MNLGLIEVDQNEMIILTIKFCDISGYSSEELIGVKASSLLVSEESKQLIIDKIKNKQVIL